MKMRLGKQRSPSWIGVKRVVMSKFDEATVRSVAAFFLGKAAFVIADLKTGKRPTARLGKCGSPNWGGKSRLEQSCGSYGPYRSSGSPIQILTGDTHFLTVPM
jgi:hypothetical protein